ncbi:MAG: ring-cleaving dioxygenase [Cytophagales bacterium]|nr:ring-cleaving dioxygenase [Cytophagales bacterium]
METLINGLHHVTALASGAQKNVDFYTGILGLRMVKKTINFDAPDVYHLYYGDEAGSPGTIMTFFPYGGLTRGRKGVGQLTYTAFTIPQNALSYWMDRLAKYNIPFDKPAKRFDETFIRFEDNDGLGIELVAAANDTRRGWNGGTVPAENAITGFHTVTLHENKADGTLRLLTDVMQHRVVAQDGDYTRLAAGNGAPGSYVDVLHQPTALRGLQGAGTVHHVAFSTDSDATQLRIREQLLSAGYGPTTVQDRNYFHSIYFREPGGVLFEIATNPPGFAIDEEPGRLGKELKLPAWYEPRRAQIEAGLEPIEMRAFS